ncbi:conserved Plasmodium protein, unknown function [Plasmodium ovale wallikeri]|uniref:Uncharacterized protein n=1 Tax=Plasmodium ovale wallikeri TaxID=864142 RepID=A0A1A8YU00_PLAOA|nr:conserved Plasmodium protein, unknown function [Plasmodium ovale wallikeri]
MGGNLCAFQRKKYDQTRNTSIPNSFEKKLNAQPKKVHRKSPDERKKVKNERGIKEKEKERNYMVVLSNNKDDTHVTELERFTSDSSATLALGVKASNLVENITHERNKFEVSYSDVSKMEHARKRSKSCPNFLVNKNRIIITKAASFNDIFLKNVNIGNTPIFIFSNELYKQRKKTERESNIDLSHETLSCSGDIYSEDNVGTSDETITTEELSVSRHETREVPQISRERSVVGEPRKYIKVAKSLALSRDTIYEKGKLPPVKCNSSYFNERGVIIYF